MASEKKCAPVLEIKKSFSPEIRKGRKYNSSVQNMLSHIKVPLTSKVSMLNLRKHLHNLAYS